MGDELAAKIRAAFDAYIFLSYRKKDRKYANELMRLIHKNDFCRDIASWYDEYPETAKQKKTVIPAELEKTDHETLLKQYPGIPSLVDAREGVALSKSLESALSRIAIRENDTDPQHNFFHRVGIS